MIDLRGNLINSYKRNLKEIKELEENIDFLIELKKISEDKVATENNIRRIRRMLYNSRRNLGFLYKSLKKLDVDVEKEVMCNDCK